MRVKKFLYRALPFLKRLFSFGENLNATVNTFLNRGVSMALRYDVFKNSHLCRKVALITTGVMITFLYGIVLLNGAHTHAAHLPHPSKLVKTPSVSHINASVTKRLTHSPAIKVHAKSFNDLLKTFDRYGYDLQQVRRGEIDVPRLEMVNLPKDMGETKNINARKKAFIKSLLPMVLQTNEKILQDRKYLLQLTNKMFLSSSEEKWLQDLADRYNLESVDIEELKRRVDIVPPSLFLAQAIMETGWGTSFAARTKQSLFGVTLKSGVKSYDSLQESVDAYIHNLNYNWAYREMRDLRFDMRVKNKELCSHKLIGKLLRYCERRMWYVDKIRDTILKNNLKEFDACQLESV